MCNRYRMAAGQAELAAAMGVELPFDNYPNLPPSELFPTKPAWVARERGGRRVLDVMAWGFPHLITTPGGKRVEKPVTNVRNYRSPFWRSALASPEQRCLVAVTWFSEYGPGQPGRLPQHWFSVPSRPVFAFAGVWRPLGDGAAFAFLTCDPNPLVAPVHPRRCRSSWTRTITTAGSNATTKPRSSSPHPTRRS